MKSVSQKEEPKGEIFLSAKLDDYGLDPEAFRIYCRIARRCGKDPNGRAFDSVPNLARTLRIGINTVRKRLKTLEQFNFIFREPRPGDTDRYGLCPASAWIPSAHEKVSTNEKERTQKREDSPHENVKGVVTESLDEGIPSEVLPFRGLRDIPPQAADAQAVFDYWRERTKRTASRFTKAREKKVKARLKDGYTVDQIKHAIDGCLSSRHHMGDNKSGKIFDDLELICRSDTKLEEFIGYNRKAEGVNNAQRKNISGRERSAANAAATRQLVERLTGAAMESGEPKALPGQTCDDHREGDISIQRTTARD